MNFVGCIALVSQARAMHPQRSKLRMVIIVAHFMDTYSIAHKTSFHLRPLTKQLDGRFNYREPFVAIVESLCQLAKRLLRDIRFSVPILPQGRKTGNGKRRREKIKVVSSSKER